MRAVNVLGVDIGTTHVKAMLVTAAGEVAEASVPTPWRTADGLRVMQTEDLLTAVERAIREVVGRKDPGVSFVDAVGVTSMGEAGLFVDGRTCSEISGWQSVETVRPLYEALVRERGALALYRRTGVSPAPKFSLFQIKRDYARHTGASWLSVADYLVWHWTGGRRVTHESLAARTMLFNGQEQQWDDELLHWAGIDARHMPEVLGPDGFAGEVAVTGCRALKGAKIFHAGHDHIAAAFGGDLQSDELMDSTGTAEPILVRRSRPLIDERTLALQMMWGRSLFGDGDYIGLLPTPAGGGAESWAREVLGLAPEDLLSPRWPAEERFDPLGWNDGRAAWTGLGVTTTRQDLYWAVLHGVARTLGEKVAAAEELLGMTVPSLKVVGGITHHSAWLRVRARYLSKSLKLMRPASAALVGAVRYAAEGLSAVCPLAVEWILVEGG
jgi:sugar (pentulose or hexulose) kinase